MGRPKLFNREDVLEKAVPLFWKQGYADTSLQDLERATAVNKSGLYAEFAGKEDLFIASLRHYIENRGGRKILAMEPPGWHNIEAFLLHGQTRMWGQRGCFAVNCLRDIAVLPPAALKAVKDNRASLLRLITKNVAAESTKLTSDEIAPIVLTFFVGHCLEQNLGLAADSSKKIEAFMRAVRGL